MTIDNIKTVGIIGAGTMGQGIAQVCLLAGYTVKLYDIKSEFIDRALVNIEKGLHTAVEKKKITETQKVEALNKITHTYELTDVRADLIIEAVVENLDLKRQIFKALENVNSPECILTTNTSSIPVTQIGSVLKTPERFAGLHFFNPASLMKLVEVISGTSTSPAIIKTLKEFSNKVGKVAVVTNDSPGFIVNRVARHYYVESLKILEENVSNINTIDTLLKNSGFKMGPFELMDLIGVDTNFSVTNSIFQSFHFESRFRPNRIQQQKVIAGQHGKKSGKGFYNYE